MSSRPDVQTTGTGMPPTPVSIRSARNRFGSLVDEVAAGTSILICRRSMPLAVLLPVSDYEHLAEISRRDQSLAAILRAAGITVERWTPSAVIEAIVQILEERRA